MFEGVTLSSVLGVRNGINGGEDCKIVENPNGMSLLERLCAFRGGRFSVRVEFPELDLAKGEDGGNRACEFEFEFVSRSSMDTSYVAWSEEREEGESRYGDGLKGGRESRGKKEGCDNDRECDGPGL